MGSWYPGEAALANQLALHVMNEVSTVDPLPEAGPPTEPGFFPCACSTHTHTQYTRVLGELHNLRLEFQTVLRDHARM